MKILFIYLYLKSVIKYMEQPLCTFALFDKFKQISKQIAVLQKNGEQQDLNDLVQGIKELFEYIPQIYIKVWELMINLFKQLVVHSNKNNLTLKNLSSIFSDIIFRSQDQQTNDLYQWRNFSELLIFIIQNKDQIFLSSKQRISSKNIEIEVNNGFSEETKSQQTE